MPQALLVLEDGTIFKGAPLGASGHCVGELVFNTAMTGYQEILTDPSYAEQIITFTYPHIGNVGCNSEDNEQTNVHANGLIVRDYQHYPSNWRSEIDLNTFCQTQKIVGITGIDTRQLTHILREKGSLHACITHEHDAEQALKLAQDYPGLSAIDLATQVSTKETYQWQQPLWQSSAKSNQHHVVVYDFGVKQNILRHLVSQGCKVTVVPAKTSLQDVLALNPQGVVLSNGPGDPAACTDIITTIKELIETPLPILGICLGCQLLALAMGAKTQKMKFGHHGANHPVLDLASKRVIITSQNHNFAVDESSLNDDITITHRSLFDNTVQGFRFKNKPILAFQGHPEAGPGPHEFSQVFEEFVALLT